MYSEVRGHRRPSTKKKKTKKESLDGCISVHRSVRLPDGLPIALPDSAHILPPPSLSSVCSPPIAEKIKQKTKALGAKKKTNRSAYLHPVSVFKRVCNKFRVCISVFVFVQDGGVCVCVFSNTCMCERVFSLCRRMRRFLSRSCHRRRKRSCHSND